MKNAPGLKPTQFTGMMRLDHELRGFADLQKISKPVTSLGKITVWGNHSATQYPDVFQAECDGKGLAHDQRPGLARAELHPYGAEARRRDHRRARTVLRRERGECRHRPFATGLSAPDGDWVTMGVPSDGSYGIPEGVIFGYPVTCRGGQYQVVKGIEISDFSRKRIDATLKELHEERDSVKASSHERGQTFSRGALPGKAAQIVGTINANHALMAKRVGYRAIYSGGGVAAGQLGMPDLGISNLDDVLTDIRRITDVCDLPLRRRRYGLWRERLQRRRTTRSLIKFGAAAMHIEDQVGAKRCGHRPGKELVSADEMADRIKAAVDARTDPRSSSWRAPTPWPTKA